MAALRRMAAAAYALASLGVILFQVALAAGAPWGSYAMGGAFPGRYPPALRVAALVQAALVALMTAVVLSRARIAFPAWSRASRWLVWLVVAAAGVGFVLNLATPSEVERRMWAPVAFVLLASSLMVASGEARS